MSLHIQSYLYNLHISNFMYVRNRLNRFQLSMSRFANMSKITLGYHDFNYTNMMYAIR